MTIFTQPAVAGGLLGAAHGVAAIPSRWIDKLEYRYALEAAAAVALVGLDPGTWAPVPGVWAYHPSPDPNTTG